MISTILETFYLTVRLFCGKVCACAGTPSLAVVYLVNWILGFYVNLELYHTLP